MSTHPLDNAVLVTTAVLYFDTAAVEINHRKDWLGASHQVSEVKVGTQREYSYSSELESIVCKLVCKTLGVKECETIRELSNHVSYKLDSKGAKELYYMEVKWAKQLLSIPVARQVEEYRNAYITCLRCHSMINMLLCTQERIRFGGDNLLKEMADDAYFDTRKFRFCPEKDKLIKQLAKLDLADAKKEIEANLHAFRHLLSTVQKHELAYSWSHIPKSLQSVHAGFEVVCDESNNSCEDQDAGVVNLDIKIWEPLPTNTSTD